MCCHLSLLVTHSSIQLFYLIDLSSFWVPLYYNLEEYQKAIEDYNHTIDLDPTKVDATAYSIRGLCDLWLGNLQQAKDDYSHFQNLEGTDINIKWMAEWIEMGKKRIGIETTTRLENIATTNPEHYVAFVCSGVVLGLHNKLKEGLAELEHASY